jgi:hypothetical protein
MRDGPRALPDSAGLVSWAISRSRAYAQTKPSPPERVVVVVVSARAANIRSPRMPRPTHFVKPPATSTPHPAPSTSGIHKEIARSGDENFWVASRSTTNAIAPTTSAFAAAAKTQFTSCRPPELSTSL